MRNEYLIFAELQYPCVVDDYIEIYRCTNKKMALRKFNSFIKNKNIDLFSGHPYKEIYIGLIQNSDKTSVTLKSIELCIRSENYGN